MTHEVYVMTNDVICESTMIIPMLSKKMKEKNIHVVALQSDFIYFSRSALQPRVSTGHPMSAKRSDSENELN